MLPGFGVSSQGVLHPLTKYYSVSNHLAQGEGCSCTPLCLGILLCRCFLSVQTGNMPNPFFCAVQRMPTPIPLCDPNSWAERGMGIQDLLQSHMIGHPKRTYTNGVSHRHGIELHNISLQGVCAHTPPRFWGWGMKSTTQASGT